MKILVLTEKPSVAKEIARVLGCNQKQKHHYEGAKYVVTWALGHLVTLAEPDDYDAKYKTWNLEDLPILPERMKLKVMKETSHQFRGIEQLSRRGDIAELVIATDAGREGELVARWIMELIRWKKPFKRLWISSQTDQAIREGFAQLKPGTDYNRLYQAAVCRSEADWLIGLNVTRALTSKFGASLSAGRVQTPTLAMMINRETEIRDFRSVDYWLIEADLGSFRAAWRDPKTGDARIFDRERADSLKAKLQGQNGRIVQIQQTEKQIPHPLAYDLTELQRDANRKFGFSAKQTSNVLQRLYEQYKIVTYPRTDSRYLTSDMAPTLAGRIKGAAIGPYAPLAAPLLRKPLTITKRIVDDTKVSDHHAIIPTGEAVSLAALSADERRLYDLIVRRFLSLFYGPCRYDETKLTVDIAGEKLYASGKVVKQAGWKEVYGANDFTDPDREESDTDDDASQLLPQAKEKDPVTVKQARQLSRQTKPPGRYTEASLLSQMEKWGLGTPATRADIIEKLVSSDTIERQGSQLIPTGKGKQLIELASEELRSPELTARWELELERIAKGKGSMEQFLSGIRAKAVELVNEVKKSGAAYKPHNLTGSKCPDCGEFLQEVKGKRGRYLVCSSRECSYKREADGQLTNHRCPQCHKKMEIHTGKSGKYFQCRPCNVVEKVDNEASGGGRRASAKANRQLIEKYSDQTGLGNSLADKLRAAMQQNKEE
ncbi:DNA topoisomerase III [Paenibacillus aceris]|uniref:DNA topoisomerase n=1 Tax=Paenibacillus aceris TaxID=869555 RepID=A0ABS4I7L3_9BACL|nr:DNA topoisomerase III [Paenibacillus aceris]MBP1966903.1 DNA topoisomerase-3 [Paenibacillus aceris]NHW38974.1 DNA topoisomerase III [Paenibacillus aceris]